MSFGQRVPALRQSIPDLNMIFNKYKDRGFVLLAISLDKGSDAESLIRSFKEYPMAYTVLLEMAIQAENMV